MNSPELWGWSTGPLSIVFWGWEDAGGLGGRLERAPSVVHCDSNAACVSEYAPPCRRTSPGKEAKSVSGRFPGAIIAGDDKAPGLSVVHASGSVSKNSFIPKAQGRDLVGKTVKEKALAPKVEKPPVESAAVETGHGVPNISN